MFNVKKNKQLHSVSNHKSNDVRQQVREEFFGLCYLCECFPNQNFHIDHFYSSKHYPEKENQWENPFHSCPTCNSIKSDSFNTNSKNEILNCCVDDMENYIQLSFDKKTYHIDIQIIIKNSKSINTKELLNRIYNGTNTSSDAYKYNRDAIAEELRNLEDIIKDFEKIKIPNLKAGKLILIKKMLTRTNMNEKSKYVSFKFDLLAHTFPNINKQLND